LFLILESNHAADGIIVEGEGGLITLDIGVIDDVQDFAVFTMLFDPINGSNGWKELCAR